MRPAYKIAKLLRLKITITILKSISMDLYSEPKTDSRGLFEISVLFPIVIEKVLFHFLYFFRARKYENRISREILGGDMVGSQKPKGTPSP